MAQPSVAREPSMEEILASIRRIIESNEPGATPGESALYGQQPEADYIDSDEVSIAPAELSHPVAADSAGVPLRAANTAVPPRMERDLPAAQVGASVTADRPQSLADIAARVRNASERLPVAPVMHEEPQLEARQEPVFHSQPDAYAERYAPVEPRPPVSVVREALRPAGTEAYQRPSASASASLRASLQPQNQPQAPVHATALPGLDATAISAAGEMIARYETNAIPAAPVEETSVAPVYAPAVVAVEPHTPAQPVFEQAIEEQAVSLLSNETGALVARSFGELAEAVDGAQRRSLDEVAEELLRPMLREWLDDNLPTLVERLVREEIERVARGPRR